MVKRTMPDLSSNWQRGPENSSARIRGLYDSKGGAVKNHTPGVWIYRDESVRMDVQVFGLKTIQSMYFPLPTGE